jgi:phosphorylated CTD-interacting factor 1
MPHKQTMEGRKKRKRKLNPYPKDLHQLVRVSGTQNESFSEIDDLMAEMESSGSKFIAQTDSSKVSYVLPLTTQTDDVISKSEHHGYWSISQDVIPFDSKNQKVVTWNNALHSWWKTGRYTPGLLPDFQVDLSRHFQIEKLSNSLLTSCNEVRMPTFERWIIDSKLEEEKVLDPVIPIATTSTEASRRLLRELSDHMDIDKAENLVQNLCIMAKAAAQEISVLQQRNWNVCPLRKGDRIHIEDHEDDFLALMYNRKSWKKPYCIKINKLHYSKLKTLFERVHGKTSSKLLHVFHLFVMCLIIRYSSLSGGQLLNDLRGGGMQGSIHPHVFVSLSLFFGRPCIEAFASPLNSYYPQFGSAFGDIDWHFGSFGDFFQQQHEFQEGCFEANPPFSPGLMTRMAKEMERRLDRANEKQLNLTYVVVVPTAASKSSSVAKEFANESFQLFLQLSYHHFILESRDHGFVEGAQHLKPTRYKQSSYDTSIFILNSKAASKNMSDISQLETNIREAFRTKHGTE